MEAHLEGQLELIAIVYRQDELAVILSRLEAADIWVCRHSKGHVAVDVPLTLALGGVRLFVHREEAEEARALLAECGSWERIGGVYENSLWLDWLVALLLLFLAATPPPARIPSVVIGASAVARTED